ncbi:MULTISPECIES: thioesterase II family protein [Amycolatopsis]|uniref:Thioesterase n=1 Tax=Amycolatopsis dendrobii TaxID=2760662 RepID=A0A7W3Z7X6_9PSEU|nr:MULTISPECIES: thioesterase domain-containing protein [Amycolatopsis]MBB1151751.1 thioesterase [Amycolatopsis dendrobii]UKD58036.1 alpha/beta fold hydrolase [Amycolatopsis sp. FU40]
MSPATTARANRWLLRTPSPRARARVFCLPYPGCGASMYRNWPRYLGTTELCPVQLPGRENRLRDPLPPTFEELADELADALAPLLDRPFALFGHCGSAVAAFVAAQRLHGRGTAPARLFVSAQPAPDDGPPSRFLRLDDEALRTELATLIRQLGGDPAPAFIDLGVRVLRADVEIHRRYQPPAPEPLGVALSVLAWSEDREVPAESMRGWDAYGTVRHHRLEGGHFSFLNAPPSLRTVLATDFDPVQAGLDRPKGRRA